MERVLEIRFSGTQNQSKNRFGYFEKSSNIYGQKKMKKSHVQLALKVKNQRGLHLMKVFLNWTFHQLGNLFFQYF